MDKLLKTLSILADVLTILGISAVGILGAVSSQKHLLGHRLFRFSVISFRLAIVLLVGILLYRFAALPYGYALVILKDQAQPYGWETGREFEHIMAYAVASLLAAAVFVPASLSIMTSSLYYPHLFLSRLTGGFMSFNRKRYPRFLKLEIIDAHYGANTSFVDVTHLLRGMIADGQLDVQASNLLAGDPIFGIPKELRVHYRHDELEASVIVPEGHKLLLPPISN